MKTNNTSKSGKGGLGFIFSVVLLDVMGLGLLMPIQAYIVRQYSQEVIMVALIFVLAGLLLARVKIRAHESKPIDAHAMAD